MNATVERTVLKVVMPAASIKPYLKQRINQSINWMFWLWFGGMILVDAAGFLGYDTTIISKVAHYGQAAATLSCLVYALRYVWAWIFEKSTTTQYIGR